MKSIEENIENLSRVVNREAKAEADRVLAEAKSKSESILRHARKQAVEERDEILDQARQEVKQLREQAISTNRMKARTMELDYREKLLENVFVESLQQVPSIQKWTDYPQLAQQLIQEAVEMLKSDILLVRVDKKTRDFITDPILTALSKELHVKLSFGKPLDEGIGVIVETADGHLIYDNTLETRLIRVQNSLRSPVYHILMGESL
jgi:vacuolar-type H+-ATPase subunit E/Vma4